MTSFPKHDLLSVRSLIATGLVFASAIIVLAFGPKIAFFFLVIK